MEQNSPQPRNISLNSATYLTAAHLKQQWPISTGFEVAFAGRSNVGKSSAINAITDHHGLAKTSKTPGRTQQIVFFDLNSGDRLVDFPGYGYAKVPANVKLHWKRTISDFIETRDVLCGLVLPMDIRHPLTPLDITMLEWCSSVGLPVHVLLTKSDKLSKSRANAALFEVRKELKAYSASSIQLFSASKKVGVQEARKAIIDFLLDAKKSPSNNSE
jgi:GTP-binding protein